jgi:hypothetical protein
MTRTSPETEKMAQQAVEEARMVLPGMQALFGFQLIAVFNNRFSQLPFRDQVVHFCALLLVAVAIALIMTPAAYHRQVERGKNSNFFVYLASRLVAAALVPLMLGLCLDVYVLGELIFASSLPALTSATVLLIIFVGAWFVFPFLAKRDR